MGKIAITTSAGSDVAAPLRIAVLSAIRVSREGLCFLLERDEVITIAHHGDPSPASIASLLESVPDVVLIDGSCRESVNALSCIRAALPSMAVVVYGVQPVRDLLLSCARDGATVVASHDTAADAVVDLIKSAACGHLDGEARLNATLLGELASYAQVRAAEITQLTRREREIAFALAGGLTNKEIAQQFCISLPTVKSHVHCILRKLGIGSRDQVWSRLRDAAAA
jgi:DNA-binding NarL/FixJ family response regulator